MEPWQGSQWIAWVDRPLLKSLARFELVRSETDGPTVALDGLDLGPSGVIRHLACKRAQCGVVWLHKGVLHCHQLTYVGAQPATLCGHERLSGSNTSSCASDSAG